MDTLTIVPIENREVTIAEIQPNKRRRKKSVVWQYFTVEKVSPECVKAYCKQCKFLHFKGSWNQPPQTTEKRPEI
ncbi:hypothetical protein L484_023234 [Morus notabilis]|uniref:BED-type domain-containing protein n=1 Tax=Morus notabilis TaxID=981085 RepID=W9RYP9_9ROSA|nr:hypothetical protein L484_023234 [Morus notabilis]